MGVWLQSQMLSVHKFASCAILRSDLKLQVHTYMEALTSEMKLEEKEGKRL